MEKKNLKYFMRPEAKQEQVLEVPGLESIKDEQGNVVPLKIKKLHNETINKINDMYTERAPMRDRKGNFVIQNGEVVFKVERDRAKATRHIIAEALVEPDLKDPELMKFFNCADIAEMPLKVFPSNDEYAYISKKVMQVLGLAEEDEKDGKDLEEAKN